MSSTTPGRATPGTDTDAPRITKTTAAPDRDPNLRAPEQLRQLAAQASAELANSSAEQLIAWVAENFDTRTVAVACSMADAVLPQLVARQLPGVDVLFLDTGYHFAETYTTRNDVDRTLDVTIVDVLPEHTVAVQDVALGKDLFARDPGACCAARKVAPLHRALRGYELWFTGVRRDEAPTRINTPLIEWDERNGLVKVNPLAAWSFDELQDYAAAHSVVLNPLLTQGYPSIGCAPCTKPVSAGDDPRSGRWAGLEKTECGLHL